MVRTPSCDKNGLKKGTWTPDEDQKLIAYVTRYGCWNWRQLPRFAGLARCGKSCRLRWLNYLRPNIKRGNYTAQEEDTILRLHEQLGNKWSSIAAQLPGRTDNEIKNHWHTTLKKHSLKMQKSTINTKTNNINQPTQTTASSSNANCFDDRQEHNSFNLNNTCLKSMKAFSTPTPQNFETHINPPSPQHYSSSTSDDPLCSSCDVNQNVDMFDDAYNHGDFWTEPFLPDYSYLGDLQGIYQQLPPQSPYFDGDNFCLYGLY